MTEVVNAQAEGDDIPPEPLKIFLYSDNVATIDNGFSMTAFGKGALATIAKKLIAIGYDGDRELICIRGGQRTRMPLRDVAGENA
jgi:hypothetical protein